MKALGTAQTMVTRSKLRKLLAWNQANLLPKGLLQTMAIPALRTKILIYTMFLSQSKVKSPLQTYFQTKEIHFTFRYIGANKDGATTVDHEGAVNRTNDGDKIEASEGVGVGSSKPTSEGAATDNGNTSVTNEDPHTNNFPEPMED